MKNALIIFSTVDGHTKTICEYIADKIKTNHSVTLLSIDNADCLDLSIHNLDNGISC